MPVRVASVRRFVSDAARPGFVTTVVAHTLDARTRLTAEQAAFALANRASRTGRKDGKGRYPTAAALGVDPDVISALYAAIDAGKTIIYAE